MSVGDDEGALECWGWTDLSSYSCVEEEEEGEVEQQTSPTLQPPVMSRRSLRIHAPGPYAEKSAPDYGSASFSLGVPSRREVNVLKSSGQHSQSYSQSLMQTPQKRPGHSPHHQHNSSLHSVGTDASLLSMLDESSIRERTLIENFWGLDHDADPHESTVISDHGAILANSTLIADGEGRCHGHSHPAQTQTSMVNGYACKDCSLHSDRKEAPAAHGPFRYPPPPRAGGPSCPRARDAGHASPPSTIYGREKGRKGRTALSRSSRNMDSGTNKRLDLSVSLWQACFRWLQRGCHHAGSLMSVLGNFFLNRCLRHLSRLLLVLLMLFVLFILLGWLRPSDLTSRLPAIDVTDWQKALPLANIPGLSSILNLLSTWGQPTHDPPEATGDVQASPATPSVPPPPPPPPQEAQEEGVPPVDAARLLRLEQSLSLLWERVEGGGRRAEQMHGEVLGIHQALQQQQQQQQQLQSEPHRMNHLLEDKLAEMRAQLEEDRLHREQTRKHHLAQQQSQASHLAEMELLLHALAAKTEQVQQRQEAVTTLPYPTSLPVSVSVASESHDALVSEVSQLEAALASLRQDLEGLRGCQHQCERLDTVQATISSEVRARVREDLRALFYGNQLVPVSEASGDPEALPESLLQWLAERYVSGADLRASLASLELGVLRNISLQLEQLKRQWGAELPSASARRTVEHAMGAAGAPVTEEQVQLMVKNALRLYSQDQTGQADYALESGGGSILSTRCSETYETRTALLSLFGLPLWYFSQSPRVVIQPDVQPGNCWAFKGSTGYLVIRLSLKIVPTAFSLEHIPKVLAPSGALRSAPRDFVVYGLDNENQEMGKLVGSYTYDEDGDALQTYAVSEENDQAYQIIEVRILSNWGNQAYTCIYRFRVHGKPSRN